MVVVAKPGKNRIFLDKVIQRSKYQRLTLEEMFLKLCKAKVFSTLNAEDGLYQSPSMEPAAN